MEQIIESSTSDTTPAPDLKVSQQQVVNCMFHNWYPKFRKVTFKSELIKLPEEFISYLHEDNVYVSEKDWVKRPKDRFDEDEPEWSDQEEEVAPKTFPELESQITSTISKLGGEVFPKLNWSSPQDATWMTTSGSLKCESSSDVILLLKSSDLITYDLTHAFENCSDATLSRPDEFTLVLRKWYDIKASMEFRCFVKNHKLIGISQRDFANYYPFLTPMKSELLASISQFFEENIKNKFDDPDFIIDVYVTKAMKVWLVDINPFALVTEPLLFEWHELIELNPDIPELRIIESQTGIRPSAQLSGMLPFELQNISGGGLSDIIEKMKAMGNDM